MYSHFELFLFVATVFSLVVWFNFWRLGIGRKTGIAIIDHFMLPFLHYLAFVSLLSMGFQLLFNVYLNLWPGGPFTNYFILLAEFSMGSGFFLFTFLFVSTVLSEVLARFLKPIPVIVILYLVLFALYLFPDPIFRGYLGPDAEINGPVYLMSVSRLAAFFWLYVLVMIIYSIKIKPVLEPLPGDKPGLFKCTFSLSGYLKTPQIEEAHFDQSIHAERLSGNVYQLSTNSHGNSLCSVLITYHTGLGTFKMSRTITFKFPDPYLG